MITENQLVENSTEIDDIEFVNQLLSIEIQKISADLNKLLNASKEYESVKRYFIIKAKINAMKKAESTLELKRLQKAKQRLIDKYVEIKKIEESKQALKDFTRYQKKLQNAIKVKGQLYSNPKDTNIKFYSLETIIKHLFIQKDAPFITEEELKIYRNIVEKSLTSFTHYEDDEVVDEFLIIKIYRNPSSYRVEEITFKTQFEESDYYYYDINKKGFILKKPIMLEENLTERERNAFYNSKKNKNCVKIIKNQ